ncbi:hypothetical protein GIX45_26720 [Erwinia sp. CPCC 100877]|nr:hypothetical protein [Erwinia sp. CPCC 100877]
MAEAAVRITTEENNEGWGAGIIIAPNKIVTAAAVVRNPVGTLVAYQGEPANHFINIVTKITDNLYQRSRQI